MLWIQWCNFNIKKITLAAFSEISKERKKHHLDYDEKGKNCNNENCIWDFKFSIQILNLKAVKLTNGLELR